MVQDQEQKVLDYLKTLNIPYEIYHHPPVPTVEEAMLYWKDIEATHCKNIFFRNHKGNRHYLVVLRHDATLDIHELEKRLGQGKLSFASPQRLLKWLHLTPGSVTPFGLINDEQNHVKLFLDIQLKKALKISFHPNINTASVVIAFEDFIKYLNTTGNAYEFLELY
ncbi:MAG TPA: prolyl-tRNA synthetase associated domain-containing protein [Bacteroidales bacterium]|nr:prolyl-tRNA synthetase associated domain-containing protein [Bacteroidales bacterium]